MSLHRQLLVIICSGLCLFFLFRGSFMTIQRFLILPTQDDFTAQAQTLPGTPAQTSQLPKELVIADLHIDLPIFPTPLVNGEWQTTNQGVSLLEQPQTNAQGYIIYGHNFPVLLGRLQQAKLGQSITFEYANGKQENYTIVSKFTVLPTQLDVLSLSKPNMVLIYTCTGFMDSHRLVVLAQKV